MIVHALEKPGGEWCRHCEPAKGCGIYERRPGECRAFLCGFLSNERLGEHWRPSTSHMIMVTNEVDRRVEIHVDPQRPDAWRLQPYHAELRTLARNAAARQMVVIVFIRNRIWVVYPDRDEDLGTAEPGDRAVTRLLPGGRFEVVKVGAGPAGSAP
jgi:hypothetical protein